MWIGSVIPRTWNSMSGSNRQVLYVASSINLIQISSFITAQWVLWEMHQGYVMSTTHIRIVCSQGQIQLNVTSYLAHIAVGIVTATCLISRWQTRHRNSVTFLELLRLSSVCGGGTQLGCTRPFCRCCPQSGSQSLISSERIEFWFPI